jgi:two-component system chemotaxis sensor kinase CheA
MKIKTKLLLGLSVLIILTLFLIGIGWYQLLSLNKMTTQIKNNFEVTSLTYQIHRKVKDEAISLRNVIIFDQESIKNEMDNLPNEMTSITNDIKDLESKVINSEQLLNIEELKNINGQFNEYIEEVIGLIHEGNRDEATNLVMTNGYQLQQEYFQVISKISSTFDINMNSSLNNLESDFQQQMLISTIFSLLGIIVGIGFMFQTVWRLAIRLNKMSNVMSEVASGKDDLSTRLEVNSSDEIDDVARSFNLMAESLEKQIEKEQNLSKENHEQAWIKSNLAEITSVLTGINEIDVIARTFLSNVVPLVKACQGAFYLKDVDSEANNPIFELLGSYAYKERKHNLNKFSPGEGLVGQAVIEKTPILLTEVPTGYISIKSALGEGTPLNVYVLPILFKDDVIAVIELASFKEFDSTQQIFLEEMVRNLGMILDNKLGRIQLAKLLEESQVMTEELQAQSEELQSQQEELRVTNEELEAQTNALKQSEIKLQYQQEELEQTNLDLKEKAEILENQNKKFEATNKEIEEARSELEEKAKQLALSSKYKSEFLANMSHELRTPLNSLLILSKLLSDNKEGNLTDKQVEFSKTIHTSSNDLLSIINDILDLAKIESGKKEISVSRINLKELVFHTEKSFKPIAVEKNVEFETIFKNDIPEIINSDEQKILQILKNLLSNAFKFTHQGKVTLEIGAEFESPSNPIVTFSIIDTGIGIPLEKQELIFHAFQQADGTTSRKYGGTGLGLSICRELASLLGGDIVLESEDGKGSKFTFYVGNYTGPEERIGHSNKEVAVSNEDIVNKAPIHIETNKQNITTYLETDEKIMRLLIVDDDINQRNSLMELIGSKNVVITAISTGTEAIEQLKVGQFDCMLLDLGLSDTTGFEVLEKLKSIPLDEKLKIFIYTGRELTSKEEIYLKRYAHSIIIKDTHSPDRLMEELDLYFNTRENGLDVSDELIVNDNNMNDLEGKKILLVDDDVRNVFALSNVLEMNGMNVEFAENGYECLKLLDEVSDFDLVLMDIMMPEMDGYETMRKLRGNPKYANLPIIALTAKAMKEDREKCIEAGASDYIVKPVITDQLLSLIRVWLHQNLKGEASE